MPQQNNKIIDSVARGSVASHKWLLYDSNNYKDIPRASKRAYFISRIATLAKKIVAIMYEVICYYQIMVTESMTDVTKPANLDVQHTNHSLR
jgi:hypothetical protein